MQTPRALVTGGSSGLGRACAARMREDGLDVVTLDVSPGSDLQVDVTDDAAVAAAVSDLGRVDVLLNSAGIIGPNKPLWETSAAEWQATFSVNVYGTVSLCRARRYQEEHPWRRRLSGTVLTLRRESVGSEQD